MKRLFLAALLALAACGDPPCDSQEAAAKAAALYAACVQNYNGSSDRGWHCGNVAYNLYCRKPS